MFDWSNMKNEVLTDEAAESDHYWFSILKVRNYVRKQSSLHWITWGFSLTFLVFILVFNIMFAGTYTSVGESSTSSTAQLDLQRGYERPHHRQGCQESDHSYPRVLQEAF